MKFGIDLGNGWTKFDGIKFASAVGIGKLPKFGERPAEVHQIIYDETPYIVGRVSDGSFIGRDRYATDNYKICLLTAIALASEKRGMGDGKINAEVCVGLPIDLYNEGLGDELAEIIKGYKTQTIEVNEKEYTIQIKSVVVFPEGALVVKDGDMSSVLTIDIGAGTVNVVSWDEGRPVDFDTVNKSMLNMYSRISDLLTELGVNYEDRDIEKFLYSGNRVVIANQKEVDVTKRVDKIIEATVREIISKIRTKFNIELYSKVKLLGGGAFITYNAWKELIPAIELSNDSQFVNSEIFEIIIESV